MRPKSVLVRHVDRILTYIEATDSIVLRAEEEPEGDPMRDGGVVRGAMGAVSESGGRSAIWWSQLV